ncbi:MAG: DUF2461 domain-containing protein [Paludibacteraceae bacterium]
MQSILDFLSQLAVHNDREWFNAHKAEYQACHSLFMDFSTAFIARLGEYDPALRELQAKDCVWRIYRDTRFSKDKTPYKTWFGVFVAEQGGRHSQRGGYYVHLQPGHCLFSGGIWNPSPELLKALRKEIEANYEEVESIMADTHFSRYFTDFDTDCMLKRVPAGFDPDFVHADWLKRKSYTFTHMLSDAEVCAPDFLDKAVEIARAAILMNNFLNYTFEEYGEFPHDCPYLTR